MITPRTRKPDFATTLFVRDHCLCLHTQRAARAVARRFDEAMRPLDLRNGQFSILMALNRPEPPTLGAVASLLGLDRTTLTANLKPLERRGLLTVIPDETDKRRRRLMLTDDGLAVLARAIPIWKRTHAALETDLNRDADALRTELDAVAACASQSADAA